MTDSRQSPGRGPPQQGEPARVAAADLCGSRGAGAPPAASLAPARRGLPGGAARRARRAAPRPRRSALCLSHAKPVWLVLGAGLKLLSGLGYVAVFRIIFCRRMSWRVSYQVGMSELGANALFPTGGAGVWRVWCVGPETRRDGAGRDRPADGRLLPADERSQRPRRDHHRPAPGHGRALRRGQPAATALPCRGDRHRGGRRRAALGAPRNMRAGAPRAARRPTS